MAVFKIKRSDLGGPPGPQGIQGPAGRDGKDGNDGPQGPQGIPGKDGVPGASGQDGVDGGPGLDGIDGKDGLGLTWRGLWSRDAQYEEQDVVYYDGSSYVATEDVASVRPPKRPWGLVAKRGEDSGGGGGGLALAPPRPGQIYVGDSKGQAVPRTMSGDATIDELGVVTVSGASGGDVDGPSSAVNNNFAAFDGTTGKIIKDSGKSASSFDIAGAATTAQSNAESYADTGDATTLAAAKTYSDTGDASTLSSAETFSANANNLSSGTVPAARLPNPSATTLGGIRSAAAVTHQWIASISTSGVPALSQPAFTDISGTASSSQIPDLSATYLPLHSTADAALKWSTARTLSFTGDATGSGSVDGSASVATVLTLATSGVTAATYGDATHVSQIAVDAKGRITSASNVSITQPLAANPTATAGPAAVNGTASTFMRSDGAPAVQLGTAAQKGIVQVDGISITVNAGVISVAIGTTLSPAQVATRVAIGA